MFTEFHSDFVELLLRKVQVIETPSQKLLEQSKVVAILCKNRFDRRIAHENGDVEANVIWCCVHIQILS